MMREIKFRAWDKDSNTMECFDDFRKWGCLEDAEHFYDKAGDGLEWMQYTGLDDKNGVEIFEGDIVVKDEYIWYDSKEPNYRGTVEWIYSQWQVVAHCINPNKRGISDGMNEGLNDDGLEEGGKSNWRVLGNIYENPELFKEQK